MSKTFVQLVDGEWFEPHPQRGHKMTCCDCGLVHTINFRVRRGRVQLQAFRHPRSTGQRRRWRRPPVTGTP